MIHLSGLSVRNESNPAGEIAIEFTGLRPGEKLYEELLIGDNITPTQHPMILSANEACLPWADFCKVMDRLLDGLQRDDFEKVRMVMRAAVDGYSLARRSSTGSIGIESASRLFKAFAY